MHIADASTIIFMAKVQAVSIIYTMKHHQMLCGARGAPNYLRIKEKSHKATRIYGDW